MNAYSGVGEHAHGHGHGYGHGYHGRHFLILVAAPTIMKVVQMARGQGTAVLEGLGGLAEADGGLIAVAGAVVVTVVTLITGLSTRRWISSLPMMHTLSPSSFPVLGRTSRSLSTDVSSPFLANSSPTPAPLHLPLLPRFRGILD